jgi:hypothetical protein
MKTFINRLTEITRPNENGEVKKLSYADLANVTINITPTEGWSKDEMRRRFKLEDKLTGHEVGDEIALEDADVEKLNQLANIPWAFAHRDLLKYITHIEELLKDE